MVDFREALRLRNPELYPAEQTQAGQPQTGQPAVPPGLQQIADSVDPVMKLLEQVTGLSRKELSLQLLKTGFKGGNIMDLINGLTGQKPAPEAKFIKYVKTLSIWVPVGLGLAGFILITLILYLKFAMAVVGV